MGVTSSSLVRLAGGVAFILWIVMGGCLAQPLAAPDAEASSRTLLPPGTYAGLVDCVLSDGSFGTDAAAIFVYEDGTIFTRNAVITEGAEGVDGATGVQFTVTKVVVLRDSLLIHFADTWTSSLTGNLMTATIEYRYEWIDPDTVQFRDVYRSEFVQGLCTGTLSSQ